MAAIRFQCDACQHVIVADATTSRSQIPCPNCQKLLTVPQPPTLDAVTPDELPSVSQAGPALAPPPTADLPQLEGYEILAKLGEGGMGAVYKARQPMLNRFVALKVMARRFSDDPSFVARFVREAAAAANLSHPNMVQVFAAGESNKIRFIAMEFVEGRTLSQHIKKHGRLDAREAVAVAIYVAQALQYAWNKARLIHRDIKPENIFLSYGGEVKVGDLGLAKSLNENDTVLTTTGVTMGSPHYISPEQARASKDMDFRGDIYSLGCTLYHMLTGRPPFDAEDMLSIMMKHVSEPPPAITEIWPDCPPSLAALLARMLAKDRNARPASYEKLIAELVTIHDRLKTSPGPSPISPVEPRKSFVAKTIAAGTSLVKTIASPRGKSAKMMLASAGLAVAVALAGLWFWLPWKSGGEEKGRVGGVGSEGVTPLTGPSAAQRKQPEPSIATQTTAPASATVQVPLAVPSAKIGASATVTAAVTNSGDAAISIFCSDAVRILPLEVGQPRLYDSYKPLRVIEGVSPELSGWQFVSIPWRKTHSYEIRINQDGVLYAFGGGTKNCKTTRDFLGAEEISKWEAADGAISGTTGMLCLRRKVTAGGIIKLKGKELQLAARSIELVRDGKAQPAMQTAAPKPSESPGAIPSACLSSSLRRDLVLHFSFDNVQGAQVVDESGTGNHGAIKGVIVTTNGVAGQACIFNGSDTYVRVPKAPSLNLQEPFSMSAWVCPQSTQPSMAVISKEVSVKGYHMSIDDGSFRVATTGTIGICGSVPMKQWTHLVAVCTTSNLLLYINGKLVNTTAASSQKKSSLTDLLIGCWGRIKSGPWRFFSGAIDEVRLYDRALSDEEIRQLHEHAALSATPMIVTTAPKPLPANQPWTNSLGMKFVPVPLTKVQFSVWETRVRDFEAFVQATGYDATKYASTLAADGWKRRGGTWKSPGFAQPAEHPVCCVSWDDAKAFCKWLTDKERGEGRLRADHEYRLPTDVEWSAALGLTGETGVTPKEKGAKNKDVYPWGSQWPPPSGAGNYAGEEAKGIWSGLPVISGYNDGHPTTSPVGSFKANQFGLHDLSGNVWEWCEDWHDTNQKSRVSRGGSWMSSDTPVFLPSSCRMSLSPESRGACYGFRVVLAGGGVSAPR